MRQRTDEAPSMSPWLVALVTVVATVAVVGVAAAAGIVWLLGGDLSGSPSESDIQVDREAVAEWKHTLAPALDEVNDIPPFPGLTPEGPATISSCSIDSGELFDVSAGRTWDPTGGNAPGDAVYDANPKPSLQTARGFVQIADHLESSGWTIVSREQNTESVTAANPDYDTVLLRRSYGGPPVFATLQVFVDGIDVYLTFAGAPRACQLES